MNRENHNPSKPLDGTPGYSSTKLIICEERSTSTEWKSARSLRSTTGVVCGKANRTGKSSMAYPIRWGLSGERGHCYVLEVTGHPVGVASLVRRASSLW